MPGKQLFYRDSLNAILIIAPYILMLIDTITFSFLIYKHASLILHFIFDKKIVENMKEHFWF
jgi:hypothetical protein